VSVHISSLEDNHATPSASARGALDGRPRLTREGVMLGEQVVPLLSGSVHYFRLEPESWRACLLSLREMGCTMVDVYVPWSVHEDEHGELDFGTRQPRLDVVRFLRIAQELGLYALVRPGPHINAELSGFGLPERVLWDTDCQARSPAGEAVVLPMPPRAFPVPSYASRKLLDAATVWLTSVAEVLGPLAWPHGPIVLCQIDNEGALYFRDGVYEQDYHPDAKAAFRRFVSSRDAGADRAEFADVAPPERFDATRPEELHRHLAWAEFQEAMIADAFAEFRSALLRAGLERVPTCHNLPMGESATPLDPSRLGKVVECLGMDYYHVAAEGSADAILKRTSEVVARADAFDYPAFAIELAAGFPPFFPPLTQADNRFAALSCLAAGIRGFNLYMAVERDRWIGSPIDAFGAARESFTFWSRLNEAVTRTKLYELGRVADVCIVVPRSLHRLERLLHAFGPISAAAFDIMGLSAYDSCLEQGPFAAPLFAAETFLRSLLAALNRLGIAYRVSGNDSATHALTGSRFGFVASAVGLEIELWQALTDVASRGVDLRFGPELPAFAPDGRTPLSTLPPLAAEHVARVRELEAELAALCERHAPFRLEVGPGVRTSLFRDRHGLARVLFVTNETEQPRSVRIATDTLHAAFGEPIRTALDALDGDAFHATVGPLEVRLSPRTVRMLELK
jgi:beta-galactosidase